jgi:hypothetical protein
MTDWKLLFDMRKNLAFCRTLALRVFDYAESCPEVVTLPVSCLGSTELYPVLG